MITWIVGSGGLFGTALTRQCDTAFTSTSIEWDSKDVALRQLTENLRFFREKAQSHDWRIIWAAGHATTASTRVDTDIELDLFHSFLLAVEAHRPSGKGAFFLTSSAGGVYAGSEPPPFSEISTPNALSAYGALKLEQEAFAVQCLRGIVPVVIGRVSNLYGPGQNLNKLQGLLSRLALSAITKQPMSIFVSLDTLRDYIFTDDAANVALHFSHQALDLARDEHEIRVIASGQPVSIGYLVHLMQEISRTKIPISYGTHESASFQARDLRLLPSSPDLISGYLQTPLAAGAKAVYLDILSRYQSRK